MHKGKIFGFGIPSARTGLPNCMGIFTQLFSPSPSSQTASTVHTLTESKVSYAYKFVHREQESPLFFQACQKDSEFLSSLKFLCLLIIDL